MKKTENAMDRLVQILKSEHLPQSVIDGIEEIGQEDLERIAFRFECDNWAVIQTIPNVGPKRALIIRAAIEEALANMRHSEKAEAKISGPSYTCRVFEKEEVWRDLLDLANEVKKYRHRKNEPETERDEALSLKKKFDEQLKSFRFTVRKKEGRTISLNKSVLSEVCGIIYESDAITDKVLVVEHGIQDVLDFDPYLFSNDAKEGEKLKDEYQKNVERTLMLYGVRVLNSDGSFTSYGLAASSAGHQKTEKGLCVRSDVMRDNAEFFWFGRALEELATTSKMSGAEFWKMRANMLRPLARPFETEDGEVLTMKDLLIVKDIEKVYLIKNGMRIGKMNGSMSAKGQFTESKILGDGAIVSLVRMAFQGQCSSTGLKGFLVDGTSSISEVCRKYNMSEEEFYNLQIMGVDGKLHRIGDYKAICGEGCWKFDKAFSYTSYMEWLEKMAERYPGIDRLYLLRQSEEIEGQEKKRTLTRTLIQQWMHMSGIEMLKLTAKARKSLKAAKTLSGQVKRRTAPWKDSEDKSSLETLFTEAPWLTVNPVMLEDAEQKWLSALADAASCKFDTEGIYPYIMQDTVALLEVWVLGKDPDDPNLGVLKGDEVSVADVPDGRKLLCVRFPANFLTARTMTNRSMIGPFDSINGVMMISIHSQILITQDGDVDGDEMGVYYNELAIELTERMMSEFNPPVVLFVHGGKPERKIRKSVKEFLSDCADALWRSKKFDSVGKYANLAAKCCYFATNAYSHNDTKSTQMYLDWMAAASTGAIMALDQVKGNDVDLGLIQWLDEIEKSIGKSIKKIAMEQGYDWDVAKYVKHPYVHFWAGEAKNKPVERWKCLDPNPQNFVDSISALIKNSAGDWDDFDYEGSVWNEEAAMSALLYPIPPITAKYGVVTKEMVKLLGNNWYKFAAKEGEIDQTVETQKKLRVGSQIGLKEFMFLLHQNEMSMAYSMEGETLAEKRDEYILVCRSLLQMFLASGDWTNKYAKSYPIGYVWSNEERWQIAVNAIVKDALELGCTNKLTGKVKGKYGLFVLKLFAEELAENVRKSPIGPEDFSVYHGIVETVREDYLADDAEDKLVLFEQPDPSAEPAKVDENSIPDEEVIPDVIPDNFYGAPPAEDEECCFFGDID